MNVVAFLVGFICAIVLFVHAWILFGHRHKMGTDQGDQSKDLHYSDLRMNFSFVATLLFEVGFAVRRVAIEFGVYDKFPPNLFNFLALEPTLTHFAVGFFIFVSGAGIRIWAVRTLGRFFTFEIGIRQSHAIVDKGPYRWVRHPSYSGYILMLVGASFVFASFFHLLVMAVGSIVFFTLRIRNEESMLVAHFGEPYREYMKRTKRLFPFIF